MDKQGQVTKAQLALIKKFVNASLTKDELEDFSNKTAYVISKRSKVKNYDMRMVPSKRLIRMRQWLQGRQG